MKFYPPKISERVNQPENAGAAVDANAVGTNATFVCAAVLRFSLRVEPATKEIREARFKTNGCGYVVAAAESLARLILNRHLNELHQFDESNLRAAIETDLETFPENRAHCLKLALDALRGAFADFRRRQIEEFAGERALICTCFGVSEDRIENLVKEKSLRSIEQVTEQCSAGGGCGSCQPLIQEIIDSVGRERF